MFQIIGGEDLLQKGVASDLTPLRPVLTANADPLTTNATLRQDEWQTIDTRVNDVMRERLTIADDLRAAGLVTPFSIGSTLRVTDRMGDMDPAELSFDGDTAPRRDRPTFKRDVTPVPIISKEFQIGWRQLEASRSRGGEGLDVTTAAVATRKVRDYLQYLITFGYGYGPGTNPQNFPAGTYIPGLLTAPYRLQVSGGTAWNLSGGDPVGDVLRMLETAYANNLFGPFNLYVPKNSWAGLQADYSTVKGDRTFLQRILAYEEIGSVRALDSLPDDNAILVQMTDEVLDLTEAQAVTTVQWEKNPFVTNFRVLTVAGPHIKSIETSNGDVINGIVHLS